ncbi:hypothetical protein GCM10027052_15790 [Parafrigoribacterium mesophilum]|uniref:DUF4349 domain-containing protein n=1 Tax=Parafrigoribacterium mesophilum TaxID=433646 RepID=UPI0031FCEE48
MRRLLITSVLALSALSLVGCTAGGLSGASTSGQPDSKTTDSTMPGGALTEQAPAAAGAPVARDSAGATVAVGGERDVITTGHLSLTVPSPGQAADDATGIVEQAGGRVDARTENPRPQPVDHGPDSATSGATQSSQTDSAQLTLRIPSTILSSTLAKLKKLGTVQDSSLTSQDVTAQSQDLDARVIALRTSVDRLVALMAKADSTADLIAIESALSERQANLEGLEAQKRVLDSQVQLATITLDLHSVADAPVKTPDTFLSGLAAGWNSFVAFFAGVVVVLGVLVPWIVLATLIAAGTLTILRIRRRAGKAATG